MARNKKVEILSNDKEVLHPMTDGDCVIFEDGQTLTQKLSEDDSVKYTPIIVNSSPMFKVGEGNTVDYSDNVLDGAYERATLQGQTYVNYIQESSADEVTLPTPFTEYERTQHNTLTSDEEGTLGVNLVGQSYVNALQHDSEEEFVVLGESLEFQEKKVEYTNEGQIKSAMLKGQTLVNLATHKCFWNGYSTAGEFLTQSLKNNTKYMIILNSIEGIQCVSLASNSWNIMQTLMGTEDSGSYKSDLSQKFVFTFKVGENDVDTVTNIRILLSPDPTSTPDYQVMLLEYQDGMENWDIPYFEGMQSVTVSTRLENLCHKYNDGLAKNGKTFTTNSLSDRCIKLVDYKDSAEATYGMKPNTKYLVQFQISNLVLDGLQGIGLQFSVGESDSTNYLFKNATKHGLITTNGIYRVVLTTTDLVSTSGVEIKGIGTEWESSGSSLRSLTISNIMYVEYQNGMENWDLPYFEDYQVMKPVQVESVNKNLQPQGTYSTNSANNVSYIAGSEGLIRINPAKRYRVSAGAEIKGCTMSWYDKSKNYIVGADANGLYPVTNPNAYYARLHINIDTNYLNTIQVEESDTSTATSYVPHQSKTTYSWDEVILRKVGDVEDTLDLTTGEWVQRIGEVTYETFSSITSTMIEGAYATVVLKPEENINKQNISSYNIICDKINTVAGANSVRGIYENPVNAVIFDTTVASEEEFRQKYEGCTIQYVLATPIVHKVNLSRPNLQVYDDITHIHTKCLDGTLVPNIYLPSDISYPAILEPSKTYNVCVNHTEVSADNPLKVNVGGTEITMTDSRMTLTTPATLANSNVSFTGKGNKIKESMLIKNSSLLTRDLPHFNGIGSVQLGKTIENLCGSNGYMSGVAAISPTFGQNDVQFTITKAGSCVWVFPIIRPLINGKKYFVYAPNTYPSASSAHVSFRHLYDNQLTFAYGEMIYPISKYTTFTINQDKNQFSHIVIGNHGSVPLNSQCALAYPIICEYEPGMENWDWESIGYFTGTKNIGNEFMRVQNKNLFDGTIQSHYWNAPFTNGSSTIWSQTYDRIASTQRIPVSKGKTYTLSGTNIIRQVITFFKTTSASELPFDARQAFQFTSPYDGYIEWYLSNDNINNPISNVQIEESSTATTYTAHKHNGLYITKDQPINLTWEQGRINPSGIGDSYTNAINNAVSYGIRTKGLLNLKPNTTYRISLGDKTNFKYHIAVFDNSDNALSAASSLSLSGDWVSSKDTIFTTTKDAHKIGINVQKQDVSSITPSESVHAQIRLEEVTEINLRKVIDYTKGKELLDELDITRGIYIQRIGEYIFDGSEDEGWQIRQGTEGGYNYFLTYTLQNNSTSVDIPILCDQLPPIGHNDMDLGIKAIGINFSYEMRLNFKDCDSNNGATVEQLKQKLSNNPITVYYALETPIVHKVHIGNKNEANTEVAKPNDVFTLPTLYTEQTHIDLTNNGIMPKVQSRDYIAYPVSPMVSRTYTLQHNLTGGVSNLTVDLLGRTQSVSYQNHKSLIYSPETMDAKLHDELRISGKGKISGVMYIDGGYMDRDIPYIEGMKNAVNPIVKNIGKNLYNNKNCYIFNDGKYIGTKDWNTKPTFKMKPNTNYTITFETASNDTRIVGWKDGKFISYLGGNASGSSRVTINTGICNGLSFYRQVVSGVTLDYRVTISETVTEEPYKENICYVDCGEIRLTPDMFEQGNIVYNNVNAGTTYESMKQESHIRIRTKELIKIKPNTKYLLNVKGGYRVFVREFDVNKGKLNDSALSLIDFQSRGVFTTNANAQYISLLIGNLSDTSLPLSDFDKFNLLLIENDDMVILRSLPNGVHDEIDLETGKYIQRVGEITFNGTENWTVGYPSWDNKRTYYNYDFIDIKTMKGDNGSGQAYYDAIRCSQLHRSYMGKLASTLIDGVCSYYYSGYQRIFISKQDCATVNELKLWLKENPITVQYELPEPIVKDIVIHNYPHSYEDGHVIIENGDPNTPIPAQLTYRAVTNRSGQIQQHTEQVEKQEREINELETLILANIHLSQTR